MRISGIWEVESSIQFVVVGASQMPLTIRPLIKLGFGN